MVFTAPPSFSLPTTEKTVRRAQLLKKKKKKPPSLLSNDPFQCAPPYEAVWSARQDTAPTLPVHYSKLEFLKALKNASVIIFSSTTGSGKSTQLPQMILYDQLVGGCHVESIAPALVRSPLAGWQRKWDRSVASLWSVVLNRSVSQRETRGSFLPL